MTVKILFYDIEKSCILRDQNAAFNLVFIRDLIKTVHPALGTHIQSKIRTFDFRWLLIYNDYRKSKEENTMEKSLFEQMDGTYTQTGDYILPDLVLSEQGHKSISIWGQWHARYLKQYHRVRYYNLLTSGKLNSYLADIDEQAEELFSRLVKQMAEKQGITEQLKASDQMMWVGRMNAVRNAAIEIVNKELIYI